MPHLTALGQISPEQFKQGRRHFKGLSEAIGLRSLPYMTTAATSSRNFSKFKITASDGFVSNYSGAALNQLLGSPQFARAPISAKQERPPIAGLPTLCPLCHLPWKAYVFYESSIVQRQRRLHISRMKSIGSVFE